MDFRSYWPSWPDRTSSTLVLVDTNSTTVDDLFQLIFGASSAFQARARETRGFTNYSESDWVTAKEDLPCLPGGFSWTCPAPSSSENLSGADFQSRLRKICFQSGRSLRTEELHRCVLAAPGQQYVVDCTVAVTAPFGDRFRTVCRYSMAAVTTSTAQLRIDYAMTYAKPIPGWGRAMLEPAAESGLAKNFAQFIAVLSQFIDLSDAAVPVSISFPTASPVSPAEPSELPAQAAAATEAPPARQTSHRVSHVTAILTAAGSQRRIRTVRTMFVDDHVVDLFLPVAEVLLMSAGISNSGDVAIRGAAALLSTASVLLLLQLLLNMWHAVGAACQGAHSVPGVLCAQAHRAVDLPHSVAGVFVATVVIMGVRSLIGGIAAQMSQHRHGGQSTPPAPATRELAVIEGDGAGASAFISSHEIDTSSPEPEERPNVHLQRLGAVGNFLIFRWDRLGPGGGQRASARGSHSRGRTASASGANNSGRGGSRAPAAQRARPGEVEGPGASPGDGAAVYHPAGAVAFEAVFENERWQPFRGWGHMWPGHFLPTDSLRQWCDGSGGAAPHGSSLEDVAPPLPPDRAWVGEWRVDASGAKESTCDPHGWFYSFNFQSLPFSGRTTGRHPLPCVRRRRWLRAHVPVAWGPAAPALVAALQPQALPASHRSGSSTATTMTASAPANGTRLPSIHSTDGLQLQPDGVPGAALHSVRPAVGRGGTGKRTGAASVAVAEAYWSPGCSGGLTASPCSPRSPHAKLDLRSGAPSEELGCAGAGDKGRDGDGRHKRTQSAPHVLRESASHSSLSSSSARPRSVSGESPSCAGVCGSESGDPEGLAVASYPLDSTIESATHGAEDAAGGGLGAAPQEGSSEIEELLRTWSVRFYGSA